jgi:type IV pilus assembly protein PilV
MPTTRHGARGFSLVEVLVALIVISVGMLGIAKIQALAFASTGTAGVRSLAAIQAASLASAIRANRAYWAAGLAPLAITVTGTVISDATLQGAATTATYCNTGVNAPCNPATLAAFDLHRWATSLNSVLPNPTAQINCPTAVIPITCSIQVNWGEKNVVGVNSQGANGAAMLGPTYTLYVEP